MDRTPSCIAKANRVNAALHHREGDRVPVSDSFWRSFMEQWRLELGLPGDADIYEHYDLDWVVTAPNMDPHIQPFQVLDETQDEIVVRTGFEAVVRKKYADPMPAFVGFETDSLEKLAAFRFDDPWDGRRFFHAGDNQLVGIGDGFERNSPAWIEALRSRYIDFPVFGGVCEAHEMLWRIIGTENVLLWIGLYPDELGRFIERLGEFCVALTRAEIHAGDGLLAGMVIWGDVAYRKDLLFSPGFWRRHFKPVVAEMVRVCHDAGLPVIYHGCGNVNRTFADFIEIGVDAYNPLEHKAGLDVVDLPAGTGTGSPSAATWTSSPGPRGRGTRSAGWCSPS